MISRERMIIDGIPAVCWNCAYWEMNPNTLGKKIRNGRIKFIDSNIPRSIGGYCRAFGGCELPRYSHDDCNMIRERGIGQDEETDYLSNPDNYMFKPNRED